MHGKLFLWGGKWFPVSENFGLALEIQFLSLKIQFFSSEMICWGLLCDSQAGHGVWTDVENGQASEGMSVCLPVGKKLLGSCCYFVRLTVWSTLPSLSIMCKLSSCLSTVMSEKPVAGLQNTVPSMGFTSRESDPEEFTT